MRNGFNCSCVNEDVLSYSLSENKDFISVTDKTVKKSYCPFDIPEALVIEYLTIGYFYSKGFDITDDVFNFVKKYGMPHRNSKKLSISEFGEDAEALYLHFNEITSSPYPKKPEWILETDPATGIIYNVEGKPQIEWQTAGLSNSIELAYTILLCSEPKSIGCCKHCGKPFIAKNPKTEFCGSLCRNKFNVYKSRAKSKQK